MRFHFLFQPFSVLFIQQINGDHIGIEECFEIKRSRVTKRETTFVEYCIVPRYHFSPNEMDSTSCGKCNVGFIVYTG